MLAGGILYAFSDAWIEENILSGGALGIIQLDDITPVPASVWLGPLVIAIWLSRRLLKNQPPD